MEGGGERGPLWSISTSIIIGEHMKPLGFKFHQNRAINEEIYFWWGKILSGDPKGGRVTQFQKIKKFLHRTVVLT